MFSEKKRILQTPKGYRYSIDPFLLSSFVRIQKRMRVLDLGSGSGVIALLLCQRAPAAEIIGLEIQAEMVERSRRSISINSLEEQVEIVQGDVRDLPQAFKAASFDIVVTNPPYRTAGAGRLSTGDERSHARHELAGGLADFLMAASAVLKTKGSFNIIYLTERLPELLSEMRACRLEPKRLRMVYSRVGDDAKLVLVEGRKNTRPGLTVEPPLFIYKGSGRDYTDEVQGVFREAGIV